MARRNLRCKCHPRPVHPNWVCSMAGPSFRAWSLRAGWKKCQWLMRACVRADRHMDTCSDIPIMAKAGQESSDPISSKKKAEDRWKWPGCMCPKVFQKSIYCQILCFISFTLLIILL